MGCNVLVIDPITKKIYAKMDFRRPSWTSVYYGYPAKYDNSYFNILKQLWSNKPVSPFSAILRSFQNTQDFFESILSRLYRDKYNDENASAARASIAITISHMMKHLLERDEKTFGRDVINSILTGPLSRHLFITDVKELKDWLKKENVWGSPTEIKCSDARGKDKFNFVKEKINGRNNKNRRTGVLIIFGDNDIKDHATLWTGNDVIEGNGKKYLGNNSIAYFWELKESIEHYKTLSEAQVAAAKILYEHTKCGTEHSISIFEEGDHFCLTSIKNGISDSVTPDYKLNEHELVAIVHTHAEKENNPNDKELSAADKILSYVNGKGRDKEMSVSLVTSDGYLKTITANVDDKDKPEIKKTMETLNLLLRWPKMSEVEKRSRYEVGKNVLPPQRFERILIVLIKWFEMTESEKALLSTDFQIYRDSPNRTEIMNVNDFIKTTLLTYEDEMAFCIDRYIAERKKIDPNDKGYTEEKI